MIIKHIGGNQYTVNVDGDMTVKELRETIMERAGVPVDKQHLHFAGKELRDNNATLTSLGINNASEVQFHGKLNGGTRTSKLYALRVACLLTHVLVRATNRVWAGL